MNFYLTAQHTTCDIRGVMKNTIDKCGELLAIFLIFALGFLVLAL